MRRKKKRVDSDEYYGDNDGLLCLAEALADEADEVDVSCRPVRMAANKNRYIK